MQKSFVEELYDITQIGLIPIIKQQNSSKMIRNIVLVHGAWADGDKMIPPDAERGMAMRANAQVTEIKASHTVYISHAGEVADVIKKAAETRVLETA